MTRAEWEVLMRRASAEGWVGFEFGPQGAFAIHADGTAEPIGEQT